MTRNKRRPNHLKWAEESDPSKVDAATRKAYALIREHGGGKPPEAVIENAIKALAEEKWGPDDKKIKVRWRAGGWAQACYGWGLPNPLCLRCVVFALPCCCCCQAGTPAAPA